MCQLRENKALTSDIVTSSSLAGARQTLPDSPSWSPVEMWMTPRWTLTDSKQGRMSSMPTALTWPSPWLLQASRE